MAVGQELWVDLKNSVWCEYLVIASFDLPLSVKPKIKGRAVVLRNRERRKLFCHLGIDTERNQTQFQPNRFYCFHYIGLIRGWAEQKQRISIPVPALPVQEFWQEKSRKICNSLNWFKGVTFTFWIKMHRKNIFPKINSKNYKFSVFFPARIPVPAMPEPESKFFVSVPLTP